MRRAQQKVVITVILLWQYNSKIYNSNNTNLSNHSDSDRDTTTLKEAQVIMNIAR